MKKAQIAERQEKLKDYILNRPGEYISSGVGRNLLGVSDFVFRKDFRAVAKELGGVVESKAGAGLMFVPVVKKEDPVDKLQEAISQLPAEFGRNHEGYKDPTASKVIENAIKAVDNFPAGGSFTMASLSPQYTVPEMPKPGEVWEAECSNGFTDLVLILKTYDTYYACLKLVESDPNSKALDMYECPIDYMGSRYWIDVRRLTNRPIKYLKKRVFMASQETVDDIGRTIACLYMPENDTKSLADRRDFVVNKEVELYEYERELQERENDLRLKEAEIKKTADENFVNKMFIEDTIKASEADHDELVELRTKVAMYERFEKFIFGKGMPV